MEIVFLKEVSDFSRRFSLIVDDLGGQNAAARALGIPQSTVFRLVSGGEPSLPTLKTIAEKTGRSILWLATGAESMEVNDPVLIPLRDITASAGPGSEVDDEAPRAWLHFAPTMVEGWRRNPAHIEAITARGDSMEPTIQDGAIVLIDRSERQVRSGKIYAFRTPDGLRLKRYQPSISGGILLVSDNEAQYKAEHVSLDEFERLKIAGRAFWTGREI